MAVSMGTFIFVEEGPVELVGVGFAPNEHAVAFSGKSNLTEDADARISIGAGTADYEGADAILVNSYGKFSREYRGDFSIVALATLNGTVFAPVKGYKTEYTDDGAIFNMTAASVNFPARLTFRGLDV